MKYFTLQEFVNSETAKKKKIDNTPSEEIKRHIEEIIPILDNLREDWGSPIIVSSGYRCPKLNKAVGGASNSSHLSGYAADLVPKNGYTDMFFQFVINWFKTLNIPFDQIIDEYSGKSHWVHIGYKHNDGVQRGLIMRYKNGKYTYL